jgi:hypothetical protein
VIGIGADAAGGLDTLAQDPVRFWSGAAVVDDTELTKVAGHPHALLDWQGTLVVSRGHAVQDRLPDALHWTYGRLPAPLTPPVTGPVDPNAPR